MANAGHAVARAMRARFRAMPDPGPGRPRQQWRRRLRRRAAAGSSRAGRWRSPRWPRRAPAPTPPGPRRAGTVRCAPFTPDEAARADLVIDAVFGAGLARDVGGVVADTLRAARRVVAVDVPSGFDGATGAVRGYRAAGGADGDVLPPEAWPSAAAGPRTLRRARAGRYRPARCGAAAGAAAPPSPTCRSCGALPRRAPQAHKYTRGHVTVLGGATMTGAARLAADAARRAGAGLVTIAATGRGDVYRAGSPGAAGERRAAGRICWRTRAGMFGCAARAWDRTPRARHLPALLAAGRRVVADADVFTAFAGDPDALRGAAVLTPHAGEFARVFGEPGVDRRRRRAGRRCAHRRGGAAEGRRHHHCRTGRPRGDQRLRAALAGHRRRRRRAGRADRRAAGPGHGRLGSRRPPAHCCTAAPPCSPARDWWWKICLPALTPALIETAHLR